MAEETSTKTPFSASSLDDSTTQPPDMITTQSIDSLIPMEDDERAGQAGAVPRQVLDFDASRSMSMGENEADMEVTTQVLDTLDSLDWSMMTDMPAGSEVVVDEKNGSTSAPVSPVKQDGGRILPNWMTSAPPVVTKRSLFLNTQSRHRKKQDLVDKEEEKETDSVALPKYPYRDISNPADMNLDRVICFDVESTGFASTDGIIEIGAVEYILGQRTGALFQSYIKPSVPINQHAAEVHGLTNLMLASAPSASIVISSFLSWVGSSPLVAHNARFDMRMLLQETERLGLAEKLNNKPVFCTMRAYRKLYPERAYALIDLYTNLLGAERYASNSQICNPKLPNHSALVDSEILGEIFVKLAEPSLASRSATHLN